MEHEPGDLCVAGLTSDLASVMGDVGLRGWDLNAQLWSRSLRLRHSIQLDPRLRIPFVLGQKTRRKDLLVLQDEKTVSLRHEKRKEKKKTQGAIGS